MKCKVIEGYPTEDLERKINAWFEKNPNAIPVKMTQCSNPPREANSMSAGAASAIVLTIAYEEK